MLSIVLLVVIFLMTVVLHEVCHGLVAYRLGDPTAKHAGRLTLNPLKHIDPFWTVILPTLLFVATQGRFAIGMAKPVPVDFSRLRQPKQDMIWVAAAGPAANFLLVGLFHFLFHAFGSEIFLYAIYFNLGLAFFNLIPIPPLDGSRIVAGLLPSVLTRQFFRIEPFGFLIILVLYFTGVLFHLIVPAINFVCRLIQIPPIGVAF